MLLLTERLLVVVHVTPSGFVSPIVPTFPVIVGGGGITGIIQQIC